MYLEIVRSRRLRPVLVGYLVVAERLVLGCDHLGPYIAIEELRVPVYEWR